jgi:hypothetical protein
MVLADNWYMPLTSQSWNEYPETGEGAVRVTFVDESYHPLPDMGGMLAGEVITVK